MGRCVVRRAALALAAMAAVLATLAAPAAAQAAGERCGPSYAANMNMDFRWIAVPARSLSASNGMGVALAVDGCATSDRGANALVSAQLPYGSYAISAVAFKASGPVNRNLAIWAGDANATAYIKQLRAGENVLQHFSRCQQRRSFNPENRVYTFNCNPEVDVQGAHVVFMAEALTVCDVLVCASQEEYSARGEPLTRAAAMKLASAANLTARSDVQGAFEACAGYTSSNWRTCPTGQKCVKTYKPGDDTCSCFSCSAFSDRRYCQTGDTNIGYYDCCFTCPQQPICAVCQTPCNPVFDRIEVIPGVLPTKPENINALTYSYTSSTQAVNKGGNPQTITVAFVMQQQLTATMQYAEAFAYSEKASLKVGVPFLGDGTLEFGATQTFTTTKTNTDQRTTTYTTTLQQQIPPYTMQDVTAKATASTITTRIPVTIKTYYTCDKTDTKETFAIMQTDGTLSATAAQLKVEYGEQYPIDQPYVYPQATATCASNPICSDLGFREGNCCPDNNGNYKSCCSFCVAKPACEEYATSNTTMCCPARTNKWNPCCGTRPTAALAEP